MSICIAAAQSPSDRCSLPQSGPGNYLVVARHEESWQGQVLAVQI